MQKLYLLIALISFSFFHSQNKENDEYKKLIDSAISIKLQNGKITEQYILNSDNMPYKVNNEIRGLKTINIYDKKNKKILTKGINVWKIIPILNKNKLEIRIIDFSLILQKNNYQFANGGGSTFIFEYSCQSKNWELISEKHSGI